MLDPRLWPLLQFPTFDLENEFWVADVVVVILSRTRPTHLTTRSSVRVSSLSRSSANRFSTNRPDQPFRLATELSVVLLFPISSAEPTTILGALSGNAEGGIHV